MPSPAAVDAGSLRQDAELIGLVSLAHLISHFAQLLLPPLFPWLKEAFGASYAELGFLMTVFFVVSCVVQALSGFLVDRYGPRPVLLGGMAMLALAAFGFAASQSYSMLLVFVLVAGIGNGVFHPVDYTLINRRVSAPRLGHAYSAHGISGTLGWALAPAVLVPVAVAFSWRTALTTAGILVLLVLVLMLWKRRHLQLALTPGPQAAISAKAEGSFAFLRLPALWSCFFFFFFFAAALSVVQAFAPEAARQLHAVPLSLIMLCLTTYMLCAAGSMVLGGFLAADPTRSERVVTIGYSVAAGLSVLLALAPLPALSVPVLFGVMGCAIGTAGPARDLLIKRATPAHASGRVYGVIYAGLDIGQAVSPLLFGWLMDHQAYRLVFLGLAAIQMAMVINAWRMRQHVRRAAA